MAVSGNNVFCESTDRWISDARACLLMKLRSTEGYGGDVVFRLARPCLNPTQFIVPDWLPAVGLRVNHKSGVGLLVARASSPPPPPFSISSQGKFRVGHKKTVVLCVMKKIKCHQPKL